MVEAPHETGGLGGQQKKTYKLKNSFQFICLFCLLHDTILYTIVLTDNIYITHQVIILITIHDAINPAIIPL